jgi:hypothetical protein
MLVALFVFFALGATAVRAGASTLGAPATITNAGGTPQALGGSTTPFGVALPRGAACNGATGSSGARVYSYLVPTGTDVAHVTFTSSPSIGFGLVNTHADYYGHVATDTRSGRVRPRPTFKWSALVGHGSGAPKVRDLLYSGSSGIWDGGIACADAHGRVTRFWNFRLMFLQSRSDANGFTWCVVPGLPGEAPEVPYAAALPVVGLAVVGGYVAVRRRRAREALHRWV